jgi:plasmid stabilization system protein ParE
VTAPAYFTVIWDPTKEHADVHASFDWLDAKEGPEAADQFARCIRAATDINNLLVDGPRVETTRPGDTERTWAATELEPEVCVRCDHTRWRHAGDGEGPCAGRYGVPCAAGCASFVAQADVDG